MKPANTRDIIQWSMWSSQYELGLEGNYRLSAQSRDIYYDDDDDN